MSAFQAVEYVTGGVSLVAFVVAAFLYAYRARLRGHIDTIQSVPERDRLAAVEAAAEYFRVDVSTLSESRRYAIVLEELRMRSRREWQTFIFAIVLAVICAAVAIAATLYKVPPTDGKPPTEHPNPPPSCPGEQVVEFPHLDTAHAPGYMVVAGPSLHEFGISVTGLVPENSSVVIENNLAVYHGEAVKPGTSQNFITQIGTDNVPASFTLLFATPNDSVTFTRPALFPFSKDTGITHPAWKADALDSQGRVLSSYSEDLISRYDDVPARSYSLTAPGRTGIAAVRFNSDPRLNGKPFAAFSAILIDRLTLCPRQ